MRDEEQGIDTGQNRSYRMKSKAHRHRSEPIMQDEEQGIDTEEQGISEPIIHDEEQGIDIGQNRPCKRKRKAAK